MRVLLNHPVVAATAAQHANRERWLKALTSDKYKQTQCRLHRKDGDGNSFCCLGVLCDVANVPVADSSGIGNQYLFDVPDASNDTEDTRTSYMTPPSWLVKHFGLLPVFADLLAQQGSIANDRADMSFAQIAAMMNEVFRANDEFVYQLLNEDATE